MHSGDYDIVSGSIVKLGYVEAPKTINNVVKGGERGLLLRLELIVGVVGVDCQDWINGIHRHCGLVTGMQSEGMWAKRQVQRYNETSNDRK